MHKFLIVVPLAAAALLASYTWWRRVDGQHTAEGVAQAVALREEQERAKKEANGGPTPAMQRLIDDLTPMRDQDPVLVDTLIGNARHNIYDNLLGTCPNPQVALIADAERLSEICSAALQGRYQ
jgi:hypothetical protein